MANRIPRFRALTTPRALVLIPLLSAGLISTAQAGKTFIQSSDGVLTVEAESAVKAAVGSSKWTNRFSPESISGGYYIAKEGGGFYGSSGAGPSAKITFKASRGGSHDVWLRTFAPDDGSDSLHIDFDGSSSAYHFSRGNLARWVWVKVRTVNLNAGGQHALTLWAREDKLSIDKIVVQPAGRGTPDTYAAQSGSTTGSTSSGTGGSSTGSSSSGSAGSTHTQGSDGVLSIEAELATTTAIGSSKWAVASQSGTSAGKYLRKQGGGWYSSSGSGPSAKFSFKAGRSGNHDIWMKAYASDGGSDSLHVDLDGSASTYHFSSNNHGRWVWVKVRTVKLSAGGQHALTLWAREDDLKIDKVVIQPAGRSAPSGNGPGSSGGTTGSGQEAPSTTPNNSGTATFKQASDGTLTMEAEQPTALNNVGASKWSVVSDAAASGKYVLHKTGGGWYSSSGSGPSAAYIFEASRGGGHDVWLRAYAADDGSDSLHVDLDGSASTYHFSRNNLARWVWVKVRTVNLSAGGQHTLKLWARENNFKVDKVVVQPAGRSAPSNTQSLAEAFSLSVDELAQSSDYRVIRRQQRDIIGGSRGADVSALGRHGEAQISLLVDPEYGDIGITLSYEIGYQVPGLPETGLFSIAVMGDDGLRMDTVVNGLSMNANGNVSLPGRNLGIEINRVTPISADEIGDYFGDLAGNLIDRPGLTEAGIRIGTTNPSLPVTVGISTSYSFGVSVNLPEIIDAVVDSVDVAIDVAIEVHNDFRDDLADALDSIGSGGSDGNGGNNGDPSAAGPGSGYGDGYSGNDYGEWGRSGYKPLLQPSNGVLSIEAESAFTSALGSSKWAVISQSGASAGRALRKQGGSFYSTSGAGPGARLEFNASRSGNHDVWLRAYAPDDGSDSLHVDLDGSASTYHFSRGNLSRWVWVKVRTVRLSAGGQHALTLWAREDNLRIDKVVIQPAGRGAPS